MLPKTWLFSFLFLALVFFAGNLAGQTAKDRSQPPELPAKTLPYVVKGAGPSASDAQTPRPEGGLLASQLYRNSYFGLRYPLPPGWQEKYAGPPPSDSGYYVLAELSSADSSTTQASVLITAQDLFFSLRPFHNAVELVRYQAQTLRPEYRIERQPEQVEIAGRHFLRMDYMAPVVGLHWYVLATEVRCHSLEFTFSGRDPKLLESLVRAADRIKLEEAGQPACVQNYANNDNVIHKVEPVLTEHRFNAIPVRIVISKQGSVKHVHVISAFPDQSKAIIDALRQWKFKPYLRNGQAEEVETGIWFGQAPSSRETE